MVDLLREVATFDAAAPIARATMPPASWYVAPEFHALEQRALWPASWQPVARRAALAGVGDYVAGCTAGQPWVVVRADDGLRAFHNVCRHKGREVVTGAGHAEALVCGYHAWSYDFTGRLRRAPRMAGIQDFDRDAMGLAPIALETWGPWVWLNLDGSAAPLASTFAPLAAELDASGWTDLVFWGEKRWTIESNWKVVADNYLDGGYHIPHMHPTLDAQLDMRRYQTEVFARHSVQTCPPAPAADARIDYAAGARIGERAIYAWLHPNFMINRYGDAMDTNLVIPLSASRCEVVYQFYFAPSDEDRAASVAQSDITQREDIAICESVQRGMQSPAYRPGRYAPEVEQGEHHFHRLLHDGYVRALS